MDACRENPVYLTGSFDNSFIALNLDIVCRFEADYDGLPKICILNSRARGWAWLLSRGAWGVKTDTSMVNRRIYPTVLPSSTLLLREISTRIHGSRVRKYVI